MPSFLTPQVRQWIYTIVTAALAVLVVYKIVDPTAVPLWVALAGAVLGLAGNATAATMVRTQRKDGTLT